MRNRMWTASLNSALAAAVIAVGLVGTIGGCDSTDSPLAGDASGTWTGSLLLNGVTYAVQLTLVQSGTAVTGTFENLSLQTSINVAGTHVSPDMVLTGGGITIDASVGVSILSGRYDDPSGETGSLNLTRQ